LEGKHVRGGFYLFAGNLVYMASGFIYWLIVFRLYEAWVAGVLSTAVSTALIAYILGGSSLQFVFLAEAAREPWRVRSLLVALAGASLLSGVLGLALSLLLEDSGLTSFVVVYALLHALFMLGAYLLMGLRLHGAYFRIVTVGSLVKLALAVLLRDYGLLGGVASLLSFPLLASAMELFLAFRRAAPEGRMLDWGYLGRIVRLAASNIPYTFSVQLFILLDVYLYVFLTGDYEGTSILYISFMLLLAVYAFHLSFINAAVPYYRENPRAVEDAVRLGLGVTVLAASFLTAFPELVVEIIKPGFTLFQENKVILQHLALAAPAVAVVGTKIVLLNVHRDSRRLLAIGGVYMVLLLVLSYSLIGAFGIQGATIAYLASSLAVLAVSEIVYRCCTMLLVPAYAALALAYALYVAPAPLAAKMAVYAVVVGLAVYRLGLIGVLRSVFGRG